MKDSDKKKQKLTLSVDPDVVKKARGIGINISEITESILRGFSFTPSGIETDTLYEKYDQLFRTMLPLLQKYGTNVKIGKTYSGELEENIDIWLQSNGRFLLPDLDIAFNEIKKLDIIDLYQPKTILTNFIEQISQSAENRKQQLIELEMARRIIEAIGGTTKKPISKTIKSDRKKRKRVK